MQESKQKPMQSSLLKSTIIQRKSFYLKVNSEGHTQIKHQLDNVSELEAKCFYREVYDEHQKSNEHKGSQLFIDEQYKILLSEQFPEKDEDIVLKRLSTMYGKHKPAFIDIKQNPIKLKETDTIPKFIHEISLYNTEHYRGFFITQEFSKSGKYVLIVCVDGKFETICVDDFVPIDKATLMPIWGLSFDRPWEIILVKAWAKHKRGYKNITQANPFDFVESFSNPTWKYYNLFREEKTFLNLYSNRSKIQNAKIILKTKSDPKVRDSGLMNNSAGYEIVDICKHNDKFVIAVRGTTKHKWAGTLSYIDEHIIKYYNQHKPKITLDRDFLIGEADLNKLFSSAYISAKRETDFFTGSKLIEIPHNEAKTHFYEFIITKNGFFDFSLKQFESNKINEAQIHDKNHDTNHDKNHASHINGSKINSSSEPNKRYLKNLLILVKDNEYKTQEHEHQLGKSHINGGNVNNSNLANSRLAGINQSTDFKPRRFTYYEIDYPKGYNRGDAKFLSLEAGRYIMRFKSQFTNILAKYEFNWVSNNIVKPKEAHLSDQEKDQLLHEAFVSLIRTYPHYYLEKDVKNEMAVYGQSFDQAKYGFCGVKCNFKSQNTVLIQCDPEKLIKEGYLLKGKYKHQKEKFIVKVQAGQFETIVFKKDPNNHSGYHWPVKSIVIFKKSEQNAVKSNLTSSIAYPINTNTSNIPQQEPKPYGEKPQH